MYCRHCGKEVNSSMHRCSKVGLLNVDEDNSFLVSAIVGGLTDSVIIGGIVGGSFTGGIVGDIANDAISGSCDSIIDSLLD